jgi:hypothetical protein
MAEDDGFVERAIGVTAEVVAERGQWVVFLDVSFWKEDSSEEPIETVRRRINTYPTRDRAELAANFMVRAAARNLPHPPVGQ